MHIQTPENERPNQYKEIERDDNSPIQLHRSIKQRKLNPKYANAALTKDEGIVEPFNYEEVAQSTE